MSRDASSIPAVPTKEWCNRSDCTTPSCPYRPRKNSAHKAHDLSADCEYFSLTGDGRYGRPLSKSIMSHSKLHQGGVK